MKHYKVTYLSDSHDYEPSGAIDFILNKEKILVEEEYRDHSF